MGSRFASRNTPIGSGSLGFQVVDLDIGAGGVLLTSLFAVPVNANSAWVQVLSTGLNWRLDGNTAGTEWMIMPTLGLIPLSNKSELQGMVLNSPLGTIQVAVQFFEGALGPVPPAPEIPDGSGVPGPPGPPGLISTIPTQNVVHVMKNGNDATGLRNRFDLPFLTITAGKAVLQPGDTMMIWPGTYAEGMIEVPNVTYMLLGAHIDTPNTDIYTFGLLEDGSMTIGGTGTITHQGGSSSILFSEAPTNGRIVAAATLWVNNGGGLVTDYVGATDFVLQGDAQLIQSGIPMLNGYRTVRYDGNVTYDEAITSGTTWPSSAVLNGSLTTLLGYGIFLGGADNYIEVNGNIQTRNACVDLIAGGSVVINGSARSTNDTAILTTHPDASVVVRGPVTGSGSAVLCNGGTVAVFGTPTGQTSHAVQCGMGLVTVFGDPVSSTAHAVSSNGGTIIVHGSPSSSTSHAVYCNGGTVHVHGDPTAAGPTTASNAVLCDAGTVEVWGNCTSNAGAATKTQGTGFIHAHGDCYAATRWGAFVFTGGEIIVDGVASSGTMAGTFVQVGKITLGGGSRTFAASFQAVDFITQNSTPTNELILLPGCILTATGTDYCLDCEPGGTTGITSFGAWQNGAAHPPNPSLVIAGTINVMP